MADSADSIGIAAVATRLMQSEAQDKAASRFADRPTRLFEVRALGDRLADAGDAPADAE